MSKLAELIAAGEINPEDLIEAEDLIERAKFIKRALKACEKSIVFPFGKTEVQCYEYTDSAGEYSAWGNVDIEGEFHCFCNWGGDHFIGRVDLRDFERVFWAFDNKEFAHDLQRFLQQQIDKAEGKK